MSSLPIRFFKIAAGKDEEVIQRRDLF